jgi:hypothetical protein
MNAGEYPQPLVRKTVVQCPVVSGYVAARLYSQSFVAPTISGANTTALAVFENVGNTQFSVLLRETDDRSSSGVRYNLTSAVSLAPGGQDTKTFVGRRPYLEVYCTGTTTGQLRLQIDSQRTWNQLGFDRTDPYYPARLYQGKTSPGAIT